MSNFLKNSASILILVASAPLIARANVVDMFPSQDPAKTESEIGGKIAVGATEAVGSVASLLTPDPKTRALTTMAAKQKVLEETIAQLNADVEFTKATEQAKAIHATLDAYPELIEVQQARLRYDHATSLYTVDEALKYERDSASYLSDMTAHGGSPAYYHIDAQNIVADQAAKSERMNQAFHQVELAKQKLNTKVTLNKVPESQLNRYFSMGNREQLESRLNFLSTPRGVQSAEGEYLRLSQKAMNSKVKNGLLIDRIIEVEATSGKWQKFVFQHGLPKMLALLATSDLFAQIYLSYKGRDAGYFPLYTMGVNAFHDLRK